MRIEENGVDVRRFFKSFSFDWNVFIQKIQMRMNKILNDFSYGRQSFISTYSLTFTLTVLCWAGWCELNSYSSYSIEKSPFNERSCIVHTAYEHKYKSISCVSFETETKGVDGSERRVNDVKSHEHFAPIQMHIIIIITFMSFALLQNIWNFQRRLFSSQASELSDFRNNNKHRTSLKRKYDVYNTALREMEVQQNIGNKYCEI